jgi:hypothetical protein
VDRWDGWGKRGGRETRMESRTYHRSRSHGDPGAHWELLSSPYLPFDGGSRFLLVVVVGRRAGWESLEGGIISLRDDCGVVEVRLHLDGGATFPDFLLAMMTAERRWLRGK